MKGRQVVDNKKTSDPIAFGTDVSDSWDSRIRTYRCWNQNPVPYQLGDTPKSFMVWQG